MNQLRTWIVLVIFLQWFFLLGAIVLPLSEEPVLQEENMLSGFKRLYPDDKLPESQQSRIWLWQKDNNLMVRCVIPIDSLFTVGSPAFRDCATNADYIRVQLITLPQAYFSYNYQAFPSGNLSDFVRNEDMSTDYNWNSSYSYETTQDANFWQVSMIIPLSELRFKQELPYNWKIILTRYIHKTGEFYSLPYANISEKRNYFANGQDIVLTHYVERNLDLSVKPYFVKSYDLISKQTSFDPDCIGLDLSYSPGHRTRIKVALNPDFSDIPLDNAQDIYNSKYPPYYEENRFFFIEDINALGVDSSVFYSRNIVQPKIAFKMNGVAGASNWGILGALDKKITVDGTLINPDDYFQILSFIPTINKLTLANAIVSRLNSGYYNHAYSGRYYWNMYKNLDLLTTVVFGIRNRKAEDVNMQKGVRSYVQLNYYPNNWDLYLYGEQVSKDLYLDAGYPYDKDFHRYGMMAKWNSAPYTGYVKDFNLLLNGSWTEFHPERDSVYVYNINSALTVNLKSKFSLLLGSEYATPLDLYDNNHKTYNVNLSLTSQNRETLSYRLFASHSNSLVYSLSETHILNQAAVFIWGTLNKVFDYQANISMINYNYPKVNNIVYNGIVYPLVLDNRYEIINCKLQYTPNRKVSFSTGIGITTYESNDVYANVSCYGNLRYEFKPDYFLFMGFKSNQDQNDRPTSDNPIGGFVKKSESAYLKLSFTI
ncbi:MAG TPA: hypothetical protein PLF50_06085 [Candidatus Cloacimonadota bacterium]|nr:hypothetical protein [Candidatus Cloacimonadota bacterium]